jgi:thiol:disulfide interchange protein DsbG
MHRWIALSALMSSTAFAAQPPVRALPTSMGTPVAAGTPAADPARTDVGQTEDGRTGAAPPRAVPATLADSAFIRHVVASGASVTDFGTSHGMRMIAARSGDEFMIFQITPDGDAGVSGVAVELTPGQIRTAAAANVTELGSSHGLRGYFVRSGPRFQVFYETPDGQRLIPGVMWDAAGTDLTRRQVAAVPGAIPTVEVGSGASAPGDSPASPADAVALVEKTSFGTIGPASAPRLFMLIDPRCIYSIRAFQMLRPYVASGRLRLSVVPLSVLDYEDGGESTRSALALLSQPADHLVAAWQAGDVGVASSPEAAGRLRANMDVARAIGVRGTPTFIWRKADGTEGRFDGMPTSIEAILSAMGG